MEEHVSNNSSELSLHRQIVMTKMWWGKSVNKLKELHEHSTDHKCIQKIHNSGLGIDNLLHKRDFPGHEAMLQAMPASMK